ncbi:hypothetical protein [Streptomyces sp. V1I1]|uniref:hypothetical protein n=1 Tax=Streptomyces sp. V1I1 TaxID=3042272 RepID=UPI002789CE80|nr:hypothetical protein [Streptomyces sp. V1I1]MDQ0938454.1 hypothetical protein [Streptomyces sp. V1I1]
MRPSHRLTAKIAAAVALAAAGSLIAFHPSASAVSAAPVHAVFADVQSSAAVTGSVRISLLAGGTVTIPASKLSVGATFDTGAQVSLVSTVTNNTNATLVFSAGGSASVTVAPGASASVSALANGSLKISVT